MTTRTFTTFCLATGLMLVGCQKPAGEILTVTEPLLEHPYTVYKPTSYSSQRNRPVLVLCPGGWESARSVVMDWAKLAEDNGLLLVSLKLQSTTPFTPSSGTQLPRQIQDEEQILAALRHLRATYAVDEHRIFIVGRESGARAAMFAGLRNPDVFRAVALLQPRFDAADVVATQELLDPYQQMLVVIGMGDLARDQSEECLKWCTSRKITAQQLVTAASKEKQPGFVWQFFERTVLKHPWIRIKAYTLNTPLRVRFEALTSFDEVYKYEWDFGDGKTDKVAEPEHVYSQAGTYDVTLKIHSKAKQSYTRRIQVNVVATPTSASESQPSK